MYIEPANQIIGFIYGSLYSKFSCVLYINDKFSWISQLSIHKYTSYFQIDIEMIIKKDKKKKDPLLIEYQTTVLDFDIMKSRIVFHFQNKYN